MLNTTSGGQNSAIGAYSLHQNGSGSNNVAAGYQALYSNTGGSNNVALGVNAGYNLSDGSNNVVIANQGTAGDDGIIRIGAPGTQTAAFIAGINNAKVTGAAVYVTPAGQLGVLASAERYKTAVVPMGSSSERLRRLRPVTFHLKADPQGALQFGLIAEEVDKVYPELVIRDADGKIQGVRYDELAPMLLNELLRQNKTITTQDRAIAAAQRRQARLADEVRQLQLLRRQMDDLRAQQSKMQAALLEITSRSRLVAGR